MTRRTWSFALLFVAAAAAAPGARTQTAGPRVFVVDYKDATLTTVDIASGRDLNTVKVGGTPVAVVRVPGGRALLVLDPGPGEVVSDGYQSKGKSFVTIVDADTLTVKARVELGWGLDWNTPLVSPAGDRVSFICPGYHPKKVENVLAAELVTVDIASARVTGRLTLTRPATQFFMTRDGATGVILSGRDDPRQKPVLPAELRLVDLAGASVTATLTFEGDVQRPVLSADGKYVYLVDPGDPSGNPDKNINGRLHVVSLGTRTVERPIDVGSKPRKLVLDEASQQLLLLSDEPPVKGQDKAGQLRVIRGNAVLPPLKVGRDPKWIRAAPKANRLYVLGRDDITTFSLPDMKPIGTTVPDGTFAYVLNNRTRDLTIIDARTATVVDKIGGAGSEVQFLAGGAIAAVVSDSVVRLVDTASNTKLEDLSAGTLPKDEGLRAMMVSPDGRYAVAYGWAGIVCIDASTAKVVGHVRRFKWVRDMEFVW